jgi:hypothetical protein
MSVAGKKPASVKNTVGRARRANFAVRLAHPTHLE